MVKQLSDDMATTLRPLGTMAYAGNEWPEARSFTRLHSHNPFEQAHLIGTLVGLHQTALLHETTSDIPPELQFLGRPERDVAVNGIARTLWFVNSEHSDWQRKKYKVDRQWDLSEHGYYEADPQLVLQNETILGGGLLPNAQELTDSFMRVHQKNPLAQANLLGTLLGMYKKPYEGFSDANSTASFGVRQLSRKLSCRGIAQAAWYLASNFSEWSLDKYTPESQIEAANEYEYWCEPRLHNITKRTLTEQEDIRIPIPDDQVTLG